MNRSIDQVSDQIVALLPQLRRFARAIARRPHDADDLVQIAVERALRSFEQWRPDTRLESWMYGIMKNAWIDEVRARVRRDRVHAPAEAGENIGDTSQEAQVTSMSVEAAMASLPEEQRLAVTLVLIAGLSYREAAQIAEVPIGTLTSRLARGREALAKLLANGEGEGR